MKKGRAPGWDEIRADMVDVAREIGARRAKRLLNTCIRETMQSAGTLVDRVNCPDMEKERICTRPMEVQRNNSADSYYEITREDSGQEVA